MYDIKLIANRRWSFPKTRVNYKTREREREREKTPTKNTHLLTFIHSILLYLIFIEKNPLKETKILQAIITL
jgi:hypothetical protein